MNRKRDRLYTASQQLRLAGLTPPVQEVFLDILSILHEAEETGALKSNEYVELVDALIAEARERRTYYREFLREE